MPRQIPMSEVARHNTPENAWIVINGKVYDVSEFREEHPGGEGVLIAYAGTDCTEQFKSVIHSQAAEEIMVDLYLGDVGEGGGSSSSKPATQARASSGGSSSYTSSSSSDPFASAVIVVGAGLSGASAALTAVENGCKVVLIEKEKRLGGNSVRASSGINAAGTFHQRDQNVNDTVELFAHDTAYSREKDINAIPTPLIQRLCENSADGVHWLDGHGLKLPVLSQCGGHSAARTHRPTTGAAGGYITLGLMKKVKAAAKAGEVKIIKQAKMTELLKGPDGRVNGLAYTDANGATQQIRGGCVVLATGGFCFNKDLLRKYAPHVANLSTTNGPWARGEGMLVAEAAGAKLVDMEFVQVHPTGFIKPHAPDEHEKILAAECLRAAGALLINQEGHRFTNELGHRDDVTAAERGQRGQIRIVLSTKTVAEVAPHVRMYKNFFKVLKEFPNGAALAREMGIPVANLKDTFDTYNASARKGWCPSGKSRFPNTPYTIDDKLTVGFVTPVLHYVMGGISINPDSQVLDPSNNVMQGLFACGETAGGVHGRNRLAGNSLVECVVYGRVSGNSATRYVQGARSRL